MLQTHEMQREYFVFYFPYELSKRGVASLVAEQGL